MAAPKGNQYAVGNEGGQPKAIESPDILWSLFEDYKAHIENNPRIINDFKGKDATPVQIKMRVPLTLERFECWVADLGVIGQLTHYFVNWEGRYDDFVTVCARIKKEIRADQIEGGMVGQYNTSITQRLNSLVEKTENVNVEEPPFDYSQLSDEALEEIRKATKRKSG